MRGLFYGQWPSDTYRKRRRTRDCDFCGGRAVRTWPVSVWREHFIRVLEMYEASTESDARPAHIRLQTDWDVFTFDDEELLRRFLAEVFDGDDAPVDLAVDVRPRFEAEGAASDHTSRWERFRRELIEVNRFFPGVGLELEYLEDLVVRSTTTLAVGLVLYRGRPCRSESAFAPSEMGMPPAALAGGGRGNPVGIPHLYLADSVDTCMKESRAALHGFVSVATFEIERSIRVLDLRQPRPENPFLLDEDDTGTGLLSTLVASQFLRKLGRELSTPTRPGENQIEYVPTQYLCEFVKSIGVDGICYASSLHPEGWNLVLFREADATLREPVLIYEVVGMSFDFRQIDAAAAVE